MVGDAGSIKETLDMLQRLQTDVALLDLKLPQQSGLDILSKLASALTA